MVHKYINTLSEFGCFKCVSYIHLSCIGIGLDWNALFRVDKIVEKKNQINKCIIQVLAHIN